MAGICGFLSLQGIKVPPGTLDAMCDLLSHRGLERGLCLDEPVALGQRHETDSQPATERLPRTQRELTIVADATIYNRQDLLSTLAVSPSSGSEMGDAELILRSY